MTNKEIEKLQRQNLIIAVVAIFIAVTILIGFAQIIF